jgi:RNA polymerase sigma factor (sigma-70 family)
MNNPFSHTDRFETSDKALIAETMAGNKEALETLITRHRPYIYNIAWKFTGDADDAEDLCQEALIKIITNLGKFDQRSSFRTWAYRIVFNHFLNDQRKDEKLKDFTFEQVGLALDAAPNVDLAPFELEEKKEVVREVRLKCLSGMLLCLTKEQRLVYIIGEIFAADHNVGSEILEITPANYRMRLSKARKDLYNFMQDKCGLVNKANLCRCHKKVTIALEAGMVDAKHLLFNRKEYSTFKESLGTDADHLVDDAELRYAEIHRDNSFRTHFEKKDLLVRVLNDANWKRRLDLN